MVDKYELDPLYQDIYNHTIGYKILGTKIPQEGKAFFSPGHFSQPSDQVQVHQNNFIIAALISHNRTLEDRLTQIESALKRIETALGKQPVASTPSFPSDLPSQIEVLSQQLASLPVEKKPEKRIPPSYKFLQLKTSSSEQLAKLHSSPKE